MFLWFVFGDSRLSAYARGLIEDEVSQVPEHGKRLGDGD